MLSDLCGNGCAVRVCQQDSTDSIVHHCTEVRTAHTYTRTVYYNTVQYSTHVHSTYSMYTMYCIYTPNTVCTCSTLYTMYSTYVQYVHTYMPCACTCLQYEHRHTLHMCPLYNTYPLKLYIYALYSPATTTHISQLVEDWMTFSCFSSTPLRYSVRSPCDSHETIHLSIDYTAQT